MDNCFMNEAYAERLANSQKVLAMFNGEEFTENDYNQKRRHEFATSILYNWNPRTSPLSTLIKFGLVERTREEHFPVKPHPNWNVLTVTNKNNPADIRTHEGDDSDIKHYIMTTNLNEYTFRIDPYIINGTRYYYRAVTSDKKVFANSIFKMIKNNMLAIFRAYFK